MREEGERRSGGNLLVRERPEASWLVRWNRIVESPEGQIWPDWRHKIEHEARRLLLADQLLKLKDVDAAAEALAPRGWARSGESCR